MKQISVSKTKAPKKLKEIGMGDVLFDPIRNKIVEVAGFSYDQMGQRAVVFRQSKVRAHEHRYVTAWIAFKHFIKLDTMESEF